VLLAILLACLTFAREVETFRPAQAASGPQGGCGSGQVECKLSEVGRLSTALFVVRQRIERTYGKEATIQYEKPEAVGTAVRVQVVVNRNVRKTFLVDSKGNVWEKSSRPFSAEGDQPSERKELKP